MKAKVIKELNRNNLLAIYNHEFEHVATNSKSLKAGEFERDQELLEEVHKALILLLPKDFGDDYLGEIYQILGGYRGT